MSFTRPLGSAGPVALSPFEEIVPANRVLLSFSVERHPARLDFVFTLMAHPNSEAGLLALPSLLPENRRQRRDELWKHSCFELFLGAADDPGYVEVNLSPNGNWNIYGFTAYRANMQPLSDVAAPALSFDASPYDASLQWRGKLEAPVPDSRLGALLQTPLIAIGATAVLEYETGVREYWALGHAGDKPDFHLRESFCLVLDSTGVPPL